MIKKIVIEAVKQNGYSFEYASDELKNDKEFVIEAVKQNGYAFEYASDELKNDEEVANYGHTDAVVAQSGTATKIICSDFGNVELSERNQITPEQTPEIKMPCVMSIDEVLWKRIFKTKDDYSKIKLFAVISAVLAMFVCWYTYEPAHVLTVAVASSSPDYCDNNIFVECTPTIVTRVKVKLDVPFKQEYNSTNYRRYLENALLNEYDSMYGVHIVEVSEGSTIISVEFCSMSIDGLNTLAEELEDILKKYDSSFVNKMHVYDDDKDSNLRCFIKKEIIWSDVNYTDFNSSYLVKEETAVDNCAELTLSLLPRWEPCKLAIFIPVVLPAMYCILCFRHRVTLRSSGKMSIEVRHANSVDIIPLGTAFVFEFYTYPFGGKISREGIGEISVECGHLDKFEIPGFKEYCDRDPTVNKYVFTVMWLILTTGYYIVLYFCLHHLQWWNRHDSAFIFQVIASFSLMLLWSKDSHMQKHVVKYNEDEKKPLEEFKPKRQLGIICSIFLVISTMCVHISLIPICCVAWPAGYITVLLLTTALSICCFPRFWNWWKEELKGEESNPE